MSTAQHCLDIPEQEGFKIFLGEHISGPPWPSMYTNSCSRASLANDTNRYKCINDGQTCFRPVNR